MTVKPWQIFIYEFFCIASISLIIGIGLGWIQAAVAFRSLAFVESGVTIGGLVSIVMGPVVYYAFLRKNLDIKNATNLIMLCLGTGLLSALILGWFSSFFTPIALFWGALRIRERTRSKTKNEGENI